MDEQLRSAFADYTGRVEEMRASGEWGRFADLFTEDATYEEHAFGSFTGRDEIRGWVTRTMSSYPGNVMTGFPAAWVATDPASGRVVAEIRNLMPDLGDGVVREASNLTVLTYAGDGLWRREEDVYNPARFLELGLDWARAAERVGVLPADGADFVARFGGGR